MQDSVIADRVMIELGLGDLGAEETSYDITKARLLEIGELISKASWEIKHWRRIWRLHGRRAENRIAVLPLEKIMLDGLSRYYDLNHKYKVSEVKNIFAYFDGRIDLVLALSDNSKTVTYRL